jgi:hypothetical protein
MSVVDRRDPKGKTGGHRVLGGLTTNTNERGQKLQNGAQRENDLTSAFLLKTRALMACTLSIRKVTPY